MSIYVHEQQKLEFYKQQNTNIDPVPKIQNMIQNAAKMNDRDFHYNMSAIFTSLRDFHTSYQMPGPHGCYSFQTAATFQFGQSQDPLLPDVYVSSFNKNPQVLSLSPDSKRMEIGDKLISVNGRPFSTYANLTAFNFNGANEYGSMRAALAAISFRLGSLLPMPFLDDEVIKLEDQRGREYTVSLPWVAVADENCLRATTSPTREAQSQGSRIDNHAIRDTPKQLPRQVMAINRFSEAYKLAFAAKSPAFVVEKTADPTITWGIFEPDRTNLGIITISAFSPEGGDVDKSILLLQRLLKDNLKDTNALVFDIRENGGGDINMADKIPQLVQKNIKQLQYRAINNDINKRILSQGGEGPEWASSVSGETGQFSKLVQFNKDSETNTLDVVYDKPVGVFVSANCYSACDLFAANMQDNDAARIYGEDGRTGAGGANVVQYESFLSQILAKDTNNTFPPLPYPNLKQGRQDFTLAWRQMLRIGRNEGKLIEDFGITVDMVVRPSPEDIRNKNSASQWRRIAEDLMNAKGTSRRSDPSDSRGRADSKSTSAGFPVLTPTPLPSQTTSGIPTSQSKLPPGYDPTTFEQNPYTSNAIRISFDLLIWIITFCT